MVEEEHMMKLLSTAELEQHVKQPYNRTKAVDEPERIFIPLVYFSGKDKTQERDPGHP